MKVTFYKENGGIDMREHFIKFIDEDITVLARVYGNDITVGTIDRIKEAICNYKNENEDEWDTDGCLESAQEQFETEGYRVHWMKVTERIG